MIIEAVFVLFYESAQNIFRSAISNSQLEKDNKILAFWTETHSA